MAVSRLALYHEPSGLRVVDSDGNFTIEIGQGLLSRIAFGKDQKVCQCIGEFVGQVIYDIRVSNGLGGCGILIKTVLVADCYCSCAYGACLFS